MKHKNTAKMFILTILLLTLAFEQISCGSRIIGGQFAAPEQFPHQISLQLNGRHHCGGSIISEEWILTAAHCARGQNPSDLRVIAGTNDLEAGDGKMFSVSQLIIHPQYDPHNQDYDLALVRLSQPIPLGGPMQSIEMSEPQANHAADTMATISGFGAINGNLELPNKLKFANVQLWSRDFCNPQNIPGITDRMICAGHPSGQVSSCQGDSGGPLTVDGKLFGVVSWGFGCGSKGHPAMYTYVGALRGWVKQVSGV